PDGIPPSRARGERAWRPSPLPSLRGRGSTAAGRRLIPTGMKTLEELKAVYGLPLPELILRAAEVHRANNDPADVQRCALLSIKTGGCPEDCAYCSQSAWHDTAVRPEPLLGVAEVEARAARARELGATRFCMGAAWRGAPEGPAFERVLAMVRAVR